jgi:hypothetical protein
MSNVIRLDDLLEYEQQRQTFIVEEYTDEDFEHVTLETRCLRCGDAVEFNQACDDYCATCRDEVMREHLLRFRS